MALPITVKSAARRMPRKTIAQMSLPSKRSAADERHTKDGKKEILKNIRNLEEKNMRKKVLNLSRYETGNPQTEKRLSPHGSWSWISVNEPNLRKNSTPILTLSRAPRLQVDFWDVTESSEHPDLGGGLIKVDPISDENAKIIVDFILEHRDLNLAVNCMMGKSR